MSILKPLAQLPTEQRNFIDLCENKDDNIFLEGPPWSGKSLICLYSLQNLVRSNNISALFMVSNNGMYGYMGLALQELGVTDNVKIATKNKYFWKLAGEYRVTIDTGCDYHENYDNILTRLLEEDIEKRYDLVIVNEVQDYLTKEWELIKKISGRVICYGDFKQAIYSDKVPKQTIVNDCVHKRIYYDCNDASTNTLVRVREYFFNNGNSENVDAKAANSIMPALSNNIKYKFIDVKYEDELIAVGRIIKKIEGKHLRTAVICPDNSRLTELSLYLRSHKIGHTHYEVNQDFKHHNFTSTVPLFISLFNAEGFQFDNVILFGFDKSNYIVEMKREEDKLKNILYVSLTRARNTTYIVCSENTVDELHTFKHEFGMCAKSLI